MTRFFRRISWGAVVPVLLGLVSCDCEQRARQMIQPPPEARKIDTRPQAEQVQRLTEVEPNNTREQATTIQLGRDLQPVYGTIASTMDVDWFVINQEGDEESLFELIVEPSDPSLNIELQLRVDDESAPPLVYNNHGAGIAESISLLTVDHRPLYLVIQGAKGATGDYAIRFRRRLSVGAVVPEPNDFPAYATQFDIPGELQGVYERNGDVDLIRIATNSLAASAYSIEVSSVEGVNQRLNIYNNAALANPLVSIHIPSHGGAIIPNLDLRAMGEEIWLEFVALSGFNTNQGYRVRVLEHPTMQNIGLELEPNDGEDLAQSIALGERIRGYLHSPDDVDVFRLELSHSSTAIPAAEPLELRDDDDHDSPLQNDSARDDQHSEKYWRSKIPVKTTPDTILQARLLPLGERHLFGWQWRTASADARIVASGQQSRVDEPLFVCDQRLEGGEYDLIVRSAELLDSHAIGREFDYELTLLNLATVEGIELEPNDTIETADHLIYDTARVGFISRADDVDVYAFIVADNIDEDNEHQMMVASAEGYASERTTSVRLELKGNSLNLKFALTDDEGGVVADVNRAGPGADEELAIDLPEGLYFVHVSAIHGFNCEPYRITLYKDH